MDKPSKSENIIYVLTLFYMIPFAVLITANMIFSLFQTTYMELYLDTEKPLYKADSPLLLLFLAFIFIALCGFLLKKYPVSETFCARLEKTTLIFSVIICLLIIFIYRVRVSCDSEALSSIAMAFLEGDYSSFSGDNYLAHYPHQLGMVAYLEIIYYVFGMENFTVLQFINVIAIFSTVYFFHRITEELFHSLQIQAVLSVLCMGMLPLYLYATFIYGDIPGIGFMAPAVYFIIKYLNTKKRRLLLPSFFCMTFAIFFKSNNSVILVAAIIILAFHALKEKDWFAVIFAAVLMLGPVLSGACIDAYYEKASGLSKLPDGIPKIAWVAMGLQENDYVENGWYNGYNWMVYTNNNFDPEKTKAACMTSLKESVRSFIEAPKSGIHFFYKKFISQWNDPGFQSQITNEWYSRHRDDQSPLALYLIYGSGRLILEEIMNIYHFFVLLGATAFASHSIKRWSLSSAFLALCVFGGYFFHMFWEAGGRYGLSYFVLCVPMASYGMWFLASLLTAVHKKPLGELR